MSISKISTILKFYTDKITLNRGIHSVPHYHDMTKYNDIRITLVNGLLTVYINNHVIFFKCIFPLAGFGISRYAPCSS